MRITFESDTALGLVQQMQQYIQDTSVGAVTVTGGVPVSVQVQPITTNTIAPPAPFAVVAPVQHTEQPETPNANPPGLDVNGFPWDARIHSGGKSVNADGSWRYKKGVDKTVIQQVEAELSLKLNGQQQVVAPAPVAVAQPPVVQPVPVNTAGFTETQQVPPVSPAPVVAPVQAAPVAAPVNTGALTGADIIQLIGTKKLDVPSQVKPVLAQFGLSELPQVFLPQNAPMVGAIYNAINALG